MKSASKMKQDSLHREDFLLSETDTDVTLSVKLDLSVSIERVIKFIPKNQSTYCLFSVGVMQHTHIHIVFIYF